MTPSHTAQTNGQASESHRGFEGLLTGIIDETLRQIVGKSAAFAIYNRIAEHGVEGGPGKDAKPSKKP